MRSSACLILALAAPLAFAAGCAEAQRPAGFPSAYAGSVTPASWRDPKVGKETRSSAMVATGTVLISVGATMLPIGTLMAESGAQDCVTDPTGNSFTCTPATSRLSGLGVLVAAAGALAVGIPLVVLGAQKVPIEIPRRAALTVGPAGASFRYDF
jgi:hypothetical protein